MIPPAEAGRRYRLTALFVIALTLLFAAPHYWKRVELRQATVARAHENAPLYQFAYPGAQYTGARFSQGHIPLWNPHQLCGTPFQADARNGVFQPVNAVFLFLPAHRALAVHAFTCLFLMGFGFVLFARALGAGYTPAMLGGFAFAFSGASAAAMSSPSNAGALAWTPFVFWALCEHASSGKRAWLVLGGLFAGLVLLAGCGALSLVILALAGLYGALLAAARQAPLRTRIPRLGWLAVVPLLALAVAGVQLLPSILWWTRLSDPWPAVWGSASTGAAPLSLAELVRQAFTCAPGAVPRLAYAGVLPWVLAPAALFQRSRRADACFFLLAALAGVWAPIRGPGGLPFSLPHQAVFHAFSFAMAVLACLGASRLLEPRRDHHSRPLWPVALVTLVFAVALMSLSTAPVRGRALAAVAILLPFFLFRLGWMAPACGLLLTVLLYVDLTVASNNAYYHPYQDAPSQVRKQSLALQRAREGLLGERAALSSSLYDSVMQPNLGMVLGIDMAGGALPLTREEHVWWTRLATAETSPPADEWARVEQGAAQPELIKFMNVRLLLASPAGSLIEGRWNAAGPALSSLGRVDNIRLWQNDTALPRAYWVPSWRPAADIEEALALLGGDSFSPDTECVLEGAPSGQDKPAAASRHDAVCGLERASPERVVVRVDAPSPGPVVLCDRHAPGWRATVNGKSAPILPANGIFRAVMAPAGQSEIVFEYCPLPYRLGLAISVGVLGLLTLVAGLALVRRKPAHRPAA